MDYNRINSLIKINITSFIFRVGHESFLHGFWRLDSVFLFDNRRRSGYDRCFGNNLQRLDDSDVAQLLSDTQRRLPLLITPENQYKRDIRFN